MIMLTITGRPINAIQTTMYALATNVYPSAARATGVGTATAVGRMERSQRLCRAMGARASWSASTSR